MIIGLGSDLIDIRRVEKSIGRFGERFLSRIFTQVEREKSDKRAQRLSAVAYRRAALEDIVADMWGDRLTRGHGPRRNLRFETTAAVMGQRHEAPLIGREERDGRCLQPRAQERAESRENGVVFISRLA